MASAAMTVHSVSEVVKPRSGSVASARIDAGVSEASSSSLANAAAIFCCRDFRVGETEGEGRFERVGDVRVERGAR